MTLPQLLSFGPFEFDRESGELRKHGMRVRLPDQPRRVLELLLDRHGEIVTREEIRQQLWAADTFVDFDAGLSSVVRKLRDALGDSADHPRYIETVPRRGYRFIATAATMPAAAPRASAGTAAPAPRRAAWMAAAIAVSIGAMVFAEIKSRPRMSPEANDAFLKGVAAAGRENVSGFRAAVAYFEEATRKQPTWPSPLAPTTRVGLVSCPPGPWQIIGKGASRARRNGRRRCCLALVSKATRR